MRIMDVKYHRFYPSSREK